MPQTCDPWREAGSSGTVSNFDVTGRKAVSRVRCLLTGAIAVVVGGCSGDALSGPRAEIVDSAGIRIVTYELAEVTVPTYWTIGEHDLEIGVEDGPDEYTFSRISDVAESHDGSLVVSDGLSQDLRIYDANGRYDRTLGGPGEGPGEFAVAPLISGLAGDTVFAWDSRSRRITSFSGAGDVIEMVTLQAESAGRPLSVVRHSDGTYLSQSVWIAPDAPQGEVHDLRVEFDSVTIEHLDPSGALIDTVRVLPNTERLGFSEQTAGGQFRTLRMQRPLSPRAFMVSDGQRPIIGHGSVFELVLYGQDDAAETILRVEPGWPVMTPGEIRSRMEAAVLEAMDGEELDPISRRAYGEFLSDRTPVVASVVISVDRDIWVRRYEFASKDEAEWFVFSPSGELRGRVHTPPGLNVHEVHRDHIVGVATDDLDIPFVRRYPLRRDAGGTGE